MNSGKLVLGILTGAALGATLGLLFAPEKGEESRKKISKNVDGYLGELEEKIKDVVTNITKKFESLNGEAEELTAKTKQKVNKEVERHLDPGN